MSLIQSEKKRDHLDIYTPLVYPIIQSGLFAMGMSNYIMYKYVDH